MSTLHEQARAEAEKRYDVEARDLRGAFVGGFLAGHEAAHADDDARIVRLVGVVTATTMLGPDDAATVVRALVAHASRPRQVTTVAETEVMTLTEFLLARIAEDEAVARSAVLPQQAFEPLLPWKLVAGSASNIEGAVFAEPSRMLAECEAKRRIVQEVESLREQRVATPGSSSLILNYSLDRVLRFIALPYVGHPDYDEEWRP